jgi:hypothetical protein
MMRGPASSRAVRLGVAALAAFGREAASAHGFGQRFDLPLPLWLWLTGAGATIVLTFAIMALFVKHRGTAARYPSVDLLRFRPLHWVATPALVAIVRVAAVLLFLLTVAAGFAGNDDPYRNLITTMVWVVWWVGVAFACALVGDLWTLVNPWRTVFAWMEGGFAALTKGRRLSLALAYPSRLGAWPAVLLFLAFAWGELIWGDKDVPSRLALVVLAYSLITWAGMFLFGREQWLENGEAFTIAFGVLSRFAPLAFVPPAPAIARRLELRPYGAGLLSERPVRGSAMVFVLLMLATVTFDGFQETPAMQRVETLAQSSHAVSSWLFDLSEWGLDESRVIHSVMLLAFVVGFVAVFWVTSWITLRWIAGRDARAGETPATAGIVACSFVLTLVPIAVAYHLAHYASLLLTAGQFVIPLASDPFGWGWDLFGTARYKVDLAIVSPYVFWYGAVFFIVLGHVIAVYLAHVAALRLFGRHALLGEVPMLLLMVAYTTLSLWILAQPIVG